MNWKNRYIYSLTLYKSLGLVFVGFFSSSSSDCFRKINVNTWQAYATNMLQIWPKMATAYCIKTLYVPFKILMDHSIWKWESEKSMSCTTIKLPLMLHIFFTPLFTPPWQSSLKIHKKIQKDQNLQFKKQMDSSIPNFKFTLLNST